jgi:uncharacterized protein YyaL (SSP411 family)
MKKQYLIADFSVFLRDLFHIRHMPYKHGVECHLHSAINWLLIAQATQSDGGIAASYKLIFRKWTPSYPETTGYTIPTLLDYARRYKRRDVQNAAIKMAEYELSVQLPEGGFPPIINKFGKKGTVVAFDTGQVLFGLIAIYQLTLDNRYLKSAIRAADWLVLHQNIEGYWQDYRLQNSLGSIDARVAWALLSLDSFINKNEYQDAARRQLNWVLQQQQPNGWFQRCTFNINKPPITHTIGYTIEGLLESGILLGEDRYVEAAKKAAEVLLIKLSSSGFLAGAFDRNWCPASSWNCLTGSAQMASIWFRLEKLTGLQKYREAAEKAVRFIASTQYIDGMPEGINGAIAGSWPIYGEYMRFKYPNWATNFFVVALLRQLQ